MRIHQSLSVFSFILLFACYDLDLVSERDEALTMESRNPSSSATLEQVSSKAPENSAMLINNQNKAMPLITTLNQICSVKLDRTNYLLWSSVVLPVIRGNKLNEFIFGMKQCPEMFVGEGEEE